MSTVQFSVVNSGLPGMYDRVLAQYPGALIHSFDTFEDGKMHGWSYHNQNNLAVKRGSPTLSPFSHRGFALSMRTGNAQGAQTVARKGEGTLNLPYGVKKVILLYEWGWHSWWLKGLFRTVWGLDTQVGLTNRRFYKTSYLRSSDGSAVENKFQYCSAGTDTPTWVDVPGGQLTSAWNEPMKPTFGFGGMVVDIENNRYHKMYYNNKEIDMTSLSIGSGTNLSEYPDAINVYLYLENRALGSTNTSEFMIDSILIGYVF